MVYLMDLYVIVLGKKEILKIIFLKERKEKMGIVILEDSGQVKNKHISKHLYFEQNGIYWERYPLPVGDYILYNDAVADVVARKQKRGIEIKKMDFLGTYTVCVDTKKDMQEICGNICGTQHERFRDECILAKNNGIKLYVLVENEDGITCIDDVFRWKNPRMYRYNKIKYMHNLGKWQNIPLPKAPPTKGKQLALSMLTMQKKYGCQFLFATPEKTGSEIIRLLTNER